MGGFHNNVFLSRQNDIVLKFFKKDSEDVDALRRQAHVMEIVREEGVRTPKPIRSMNGMTVETVEHLYVMATEFVLGEPLEGFEQKPLQIQQFGRVLGRLHEIAKRHTKVFQSYPLAWDHDISHRQFTIGIDQEIQQKWQSYMEKLQNLPKDATVYGLVHHDLHHENVLICDGGMTVLDFGDLRLSWFAYDVAIPIYHATEQGQFRGGIDASTYRQFFKPHFIKGYRMETHMSEDVEQWIDFFLSYRRIYSYLYFYDVLTPEQLTPSTKQALAKMKENILNQE
ncbi:phosphotransferase enzyme family protein [Geomicrobium sp. JCM 19037]|uniref:phosphotransferase enzyme family protein n=1 Tax=Geomicrobium sp. JCM 19037 TaxID=1460634 RepID=UPI002100C820|nr:aminoglycoside phosphotransferase family protein [Geomicrobium sp. JCM 19037]